jgi:hypothetical protein
MRGNIPSYSPKLPVAKFILQQVLTDVQRLSSTGYRATTAIAADKQEQTGCAHRFGNS